MRTRTRLPAAVVVAVLGVTGAATPAIAGPTTQALRQTSHASYQGRTIDLSKSWEGAQVCAVVSRSDVRCYATSDQANAALAPAATSTGAARGASGPVGTLSTWHNCPDDWLCIYEDINWGGRRLQFNDEYWHSLDPYGFKDKTSSWTNNQGGGIFGCSGNDKGTLGDGAGDNRVLDDCSASSSLGSYNDRTEDVYG